MKRAIKLLSLVMLISMIFTIFIPMTSLAVNEIQIKSTVDSVTSKASSSSGSEDETSMLKLGATILTGIQTAGTVLAVLLLVWFGIKWMIAGAQVRAQLKDQAWNYVFGAIFLFGAGTLAKWIYTIVTKATT